MDRKGLDLTNTVWTRLDRKAGAIVELTVRQLRHRLLHRFDENGNGRLDHRESH